LKRYPFSKLSADCPKVSELSQELCGVSFLKTMQRYFRVDRKNIAFLKFILEAYDGMAVMRTLGPHEGVVELMIAPDFERDVNEILDNLRGEFEVQPIDPPADIKEL